MSRDEKVDACVKLVFGDVEHTDRTEFAVLGDELDLVDFTMEVELALDIDIPDDEAMAWRNIGDVKGYITRRFK